MIRLVMADVRHQAALWLWTVLCATVGAACSAGSVVAMFTALGAAQQAGDASMTTAAIALGGNIVFFTVLASVGVVASTVNLTLTGQRREHALWLVLGIPRRSVRNVLNAELAVLGLVAGVLALPLAHIVAAVALVQWTNSGLNLHGASIVFQPWHLGAALASGVFPSFVGGWGAARRASKTPEMRAFRENADPSPRPGVGRSILAFCLLAGVVGMWIPGLGLELSGGLEQRTAFAFSGNLFLVCLLLLMGPWVLTPLLMLWTAVVPANDVAWRLAVHSCRTRVARSVTTVLPFALALSMVGLFMVIGNAMPGGSAGIDDVLVVLGWVFVVSWVGGLAVIALVGRERRRDSALLSVAGARPGVIARSTLYEGLIYAITAILFSLVTLLIACWTVAIGARVSPLDMLSGLPWITLAGLAAITLATPCAALLWPAISAPRTSISNALRS